MTAAEFATMRHDDAAADSVGNVTQAAPPAPAAPGLTARARWSLFVLQAPLTVVSQQSGHPTCTVNITQRLNTASFHRPALTPVSSP